MTAAAACCGGAPAGLSTLAGNLFRGSGVFVRGVLNSTGPGRMRGSSPGIYSRRSKGKLMARAFVPFLAVLALVLSGCGEPTAESVTEDMLGKMKEMVTVLKGITDEASAKAAKPKLEQIKKDMDGLEAQAQKVEKETSAEEREKIKNKYEPEL